MPRQRIRVEAPKAQLVGRALSVVLGLVLLWYGLMTVLLACGVDPSVVNLISGYRTAFDFLAGLAPSDVDGTTRAIIAVAGILIFLVFGWLTLRALPRPRLARRPVELGRADGSAGPAGDLVLAPQAIERVAEVAAGRRRGVASARARASADRLEVDVELRDPARIAEHLEGVRDNVRRELDEHDFPRRPVDVTLTSFADK